MMDASSGYMKDGPKNRLREQDIHQIVDVFTKQIDMPKLARMVSLEEIEKNDFNLNLPRYIDSSVAEDLQDIAGHLQGGIPVADIDSPALKPYWDVCPRCASHCSARCGPATCLWQWIRPRSRARSTRTPSSPPLCSA
jgi:type I restriction enzyme M protein